jgi:hypothetical protein
MSGYRWARQNEEGQITRICDGCERDVEERRRIRERDRMTAADGKSCLLLKLGHSKAVRAAHRQRGQCLGSRTLYGQHHG